jgi:hypothetical protein
VLKLKPETETDKKQVSADALSNPNPPATNAGETQQSLPDRDSTEQAQTSQKIKWKLFGKDRNI